MRLLLSLLALILCGNVFGQVTVCASGCNTTTFANAQATATATPNEIIQLNGPITENGTIGSVNTSLTVKLGGKIWGSNSASPILTINSSLVSPCTIMSGSFNQTAAARCISWSALGIGSNVWFQDLNIIGSGNTGIFSGNIFTTANQFGMNRVSISNPNSGFFCVQLNGADITAGTVIIKNCFFTDTTASALELQGVSANVAYKIYNCTIANSSFGLTSTGAYDGKNNLFTGNTTDLSTSVSATHAMSTNTAFTTSVTSPGSGCLTITVASTYSDQANFYISPASQTFNGGISINGLTGVDTGLNGVLEGYLGINGMGCNPYVLPQGRGYGGR